MPTDTTNIVPSREAVDSAVQIFNEIRALVRQPQADYRDVEALMDRLALMFHWSRVGPGLLEAADRLILAPCPHDPENKGDCGRKSCLYCDGAREVSKAIAAARNTQQEVDNHA